MVSYWYTHAKIYIRSIFSIMQIITLCLPASIYIFIYTVIVTFVTYENGVRYFRRGKGNLKTVLGSLKGVLSEEVFLWTQYFSPFPWKQRRFKITLTKCYICKEIFMWNLSYSHVFDTNVGIQNASKNARKTQEKSTRYH